MMVVQCVFSSKCLAQEAKMEELLKLTKWERGIKVESRRDKTGFAYFWFYEWHLFDAVTKGEHTHGSHSCRPTKARGEENDSRQDLSVQRVKRGLFEIHS
jgi:hypothetical protein